MEKFKSTLTEWTGAILGIIACAMIAGATTMVVMSGQLGKLEGKFEASDLNGCKVKIDTLSSRFSCMKSDIQALRDSDNSIKQRLEFHIKHR